MSPKDTLSACSTDGAKKRRVGGGGRLSIFKSSGYHGSSEYCEGIIL